MRGSKSRARVSVFDDTGVHERADELATEEPLEIRLQGVTIAVTMRTPGNDFELVAGFLFGEGIVNRREDISTMSYCLEAEQQYNVVTVELAVVPREIPGRHFVTTSACGVCGRASIEDLLARGYHPPRPGPVVDPAVVRGLPETLRAAQGVFDATGGLHAAGLFDPSGGLIELREDVGRHNAVDKLVGWALLGDRLPLGDHIVLVSGRTSYEIVQKCLAAGVPALCAVSAPSSLAVDLAEEFGMTLVGFLRGERFNVYSGGGRIRGA